MIKFKYICYYFDPYSAIGCINNVLYDTRCEGVF